METYDWKYLEKNRMGNNANDYEWEIVVNWLSTGRLNGKEEMQICYDNMLKNKKWYYNMNYYGNDGDNNFMLVPMLFVFSLFVVSSGYKPFMNDFLDIYYRIPDNFEFIICAFATVGLTVGNFKFIKKIFIDKAIDNLQKSLELGLGIRNSKSNIFSKLKEKLLAKSASKSKSKEVVSLKDYVDKELAEKGTNQDEEIIKKQNEEHASAFVKTIGDDIKSIFANPYPNCQKELDALQQLSHDYVEYMIKENEAKEAGKIVLRLPGSNNFYARLNDLESKIKNNMKINKLCEYNKGYIDDIVKDASKTVEQNNQPIYTGPVVNGHIPTVEEQFYDESQNYNTAGTEDKGSGRVLSPNNK